MARMRSPNFPAMTLEDAIKAATSIFDKNRLALIMREDAAKDIGYTGLTGRSMQVLGALNQYDLVENTSKGKCRVTKTLSNILHGVPDSVKHEALRKAGHSPPLFKAIFDRFEGEIPGENAVRSYLIQSGFTNEGADKALKNFLSTNRYLEMNGVSESYGDDGENDAQSAPEEFAREERTVELPVEKPVGDAAPIGDGQAIFWNKGALDYNLSTSGLVVAGATNSAPELRAYIAKLNALLALLPEKEGDNDTDKQ